MQGKMVMVEDLVMPSELKNPKLGDNALVTLSKRYLRKDINGKCIETVKQMFWRIAANIAIQDAKYGITELKDLMVLAVKFYYAMIEQKFLPNSPTIMNAGKSDGQLSACFVLPVGDSIPEIFDSIKHAAMIHKSGGGTGFAFSNLRPKDSVVSTTGGIASGPLSFLKIFNTATEQIKQGGTRRGADMGILRIDHPDIVEFIKAKEVEGELNNFNLSVAITDKFMQALEKDENYELVDPYRKCVVGTLSAKHIWDLLVDRAWLSGDPGIVFIDEINRFNPTPELGDIEATNPCGEQPLLSYEACNLGSINLAKFCTARTMSNNNSKDIDNHIHWERMGEMVELAVHFLDNVIDANNYPLPLITENVKKTRKIGLGVMGFADMLFKLRVPYDSEEAILLAKKVMEFINIMGHSASLELAKTRGSYPAADSQNLPNPMRNATVTTIAPTGTLSIIGECSSGIEPIFALCFIKNILGGEKFVETNPYVMSVLKQSGHDTPQVIEELRHKGSLQHIAEMPKWIKDVFVTAMDIEPIWHLRMQAAFQKNTDNAVSKTINLPNSATREDIDFIYRKAYELGCKGITVYRDGCKSVQVLNTGEGQQKQYGNEAENAPVQHEKPKRPNTVYGFTKRMQTGLGTMYLTVNEIDGKPFEVFVTIGKSGHSITAKAEAIGRLVSLALRNGIEPKSIVRQLKGIGGEHPILNKHGMVQSIPDAIARILEQHYCQNDKPASVVMDINGTSCPDCGEKLVFQEGCTKCPSCGYSKCG